MLEIKPVFLSSYCLADICTLITRYGTVIFNDFLNPVSVFLNDLSLGKIKVIAGFKDNNFISFVALYDFRKITDKNFICYIYGASKRHFAKENMLFLKALFNDLKSKGCVAIRLETKSYNKPMRNLAYRLGFIKIGVLHRSDMLKDSFVHSILYELLL